MLSVAEFLLGSTKEYNGHKENSIPSIDFDTALKICKDLENLVGGSFTLEVWTCGAISIYQQNYWKEGEHPLGHTNRLILSSGE